MEEIRTLEVLLVEDNPGDVKLVEHQIARINDLRVNLWKARTLTEAECFLKDTNIQAILLDLGLPDSTGTSSVNRMVKAAGERTVIILTCLSDDHTVEKALECGAQDYIPKDRLTPELLRKTLLYSVKQRELMNRLAEDVTERKRSEDALRESEERFRILFEQAADVILQLEITQEGMPIIREANNATFKILGYTRDELIGQPVSFIEAGPDVSKEILARRQGIVSGKEAMFEAKHRCKDGTVRVFECAGTEMRIGLKTFAIVVERDITERKRAEADRERLNVILEATTDFVSSSSPDKRIIYMNNGARRMVGLPENMRPDQINIADMHPVWAAGIIMDQGIPAAVRDGVWEGETALLHQDGHEIPVSQVIMAHKSPAGELLFISTIMRDITERKRAEEELQRLNSMKDEFLSVVSHELRTPLTSILGYLKLLEKQCVERLTEEQREFFATARRNADHLLELINSLLDISRLDKRVQTAQPAELDVRREAEFAIKSVTADAKEARRDIGIDPESQEDVTVFADAKMLNQVVNNFLTNAMKYSPPEKPIRVGFRKDSKDGKNGTLLWVKDEGRGVPEDLRGRIFDRFYQAEKHLSRQAGGLGLGLAIVKSIMELHRGSVWVESQAGQGSTFFVFFPDPAGG